MQEQDCEQPLSAVGNEHQTLETLRQEFTFKKDVLKKLHKISPTKQIIRQSTNDMN